MSYTLHVFPTAEDYYDVCCGSPSLYQHTFPSQTMAELWFDNEFGGLGWYLASDARLAIDRANEILAH